ncbi:MAG: branched-chain amino acid transport system II carrier protein [Chlamydiales bacterium]|nr:branched-chain amino acid transport system II carrier protein [Chlamydiales bacterium]
MNNSRFFILSTGFAMFSMFFGSGNLVFPVMVGQLSEGHYNLAALGIFLTGVLVPFLGAITMLLFQGQSDDFFKVLGKKVGFLIPLFTLSLLGPFGVLARCTTVAYGSFVKIFPDVGLYTFSAFFCMLVFFSIIRKSRIVTLVGTVLTPILLLSLLLIAYFGLQGAEFSAPTPDFSGEAFTHGIFQGYQTMDLLAAFFFSSFILQHIRKKEPKLQDKKQLFTAALSASMVGMGILSFVYYLLVLLGACYADKLVSIAPEQMLGFIAENALGPYGLWLVCIAVVVACFTTAIVLTSLFADFIKSRVCMDKISSPVAISTTLLITFLVSSLEFSGIASIIAPILETVYPALIMLTLLNLLNKLQGVKVAKWPIFLALLFRAFAT